VHSSPSLSEVGISRTTTTAEPQPIGAQLTSQWFDPADEVHVIQWRAAAARRRAYEEQVSTLWRDVKVALADSIAAYRGCRDEGIQCGQTPTGGFAATQFRQPLAFIDVTLDIDNGLVACVYTFRTDDDAPYQESVRVLLVTERDTMLFLRTQEGRLLETSDAAAQDLLRPYFARLTSDAAS
jgi:hypothetical protein